MKNIILNCDYIQGFLRDGHFELSLDDKEYEYFKSLEKEEQLNYIKDNGALLIDSYRVEDYEVEDKFQVYDI